MKGKLILERDKHIITIFHDTLKKSLRYDLKNMQMQKQNKDGTWYGVQQQYDFFQNCNLGDIECKEEKFRLMIEHARKLNPGCYSVSTFISRLRDALVYENYIAEGIETEASAYRGYNNSIQKNVLSKPLEFYSKNMIKFFKENKIKVTHEIEQTAINQYKFVEKLLTILNTSDYREEEKVKMFECLKYYRARDSFNALVITYNYDMKSLLNYLINYLKPFENVEYQEGLELLKDYYEMANRIGRNIKKYPKYLKSMHDIITANYNSYKREYNEKLFKELQRKDLEYEEKKFCILTPSNSKDIVSEGTSLNHCVGSYVDNILDKKTYIFFMRLTENKEQSLITLEIINNKITQAKGSYNRALNKEEGEFLQKYCRKKELELGVNLKGGEE